MNKVAYGLVRVSTHKQDVEHQIQKIREHYPNVKDFFIEEGVSGKLTRSDRPIFQQAIATCKKEKATLVVTKLDRLLSDGKSLTKKELKYCNSLYEFYSGVYEKRN